MPGLRIFLDTRGRFYILAGECPGRMNNYAKTAAPAGATSASAVLDIPPARGGFGVAMKRNEKWNKAHPETCRASGRKYDRKHRIKRLAAKKKHRQDHIEEYRVRQRIARSTARAIALHRSQEAARRARMKSATKAEDAAAIREFYINAQTRPALRCFHCGKVTRKGSRHVDHLIPLSKGGLHAVSNLVISCGHCNDSKGSKMPEEVGLLPMVL